MASIFGWMDHSERERRRVLDTLSLLGEELGRLRRPSDSRHRSVERHDRNNLQVEIDRRFDAAASDAIAADLGVFQLARLEYWHALFAEISAMRLLPSSTRRRSSFVQQVEGCYGVERAGGTLGADSKMCRHCVAQAPRVPRRRAAPP